MSPTAAATARARPTAPSAPSAPAYERWTEAGRAGLRLVATRPLTIGRLPFALLVGGILATGLVALLLLHTLAAQDAFRLQAMQRQQAALSDVEQELALAQQQAEAPATLAARARALGMVPTGSIAFVKARKHGKVVGVVRPAVAPVAPVVPAPSASPSPSDSKRAGDGSKPSTTAGKHAGATGNRQPAGGTTDAQRHHRRVAPKPGG